MPRDRFDRFDALHRQAHPLLLPNAWDAASAHLLVEAGATAIATSSASLSWSLGYPDGGKLPLSLLVPAIGNIIRNLHVPLTVDIEDGFSRSPELVAELAQTLIDAGVSGINLEDGDQPGQLLAEKIAAIRSKPACAGLFVNARTDVYLRGLAAGQAAVEEVLSRSKLYAAAGADGLFVPGLQDIEEIRSISTGTSLLLNVMAIPGLPSVARLSEAGVRRVSAGPFSFLAAYEALVDSAAEFFAGRTDRLFAGRLSYDDLNRLLDR